MLLVQKDKVLCITILIHSINYGVFLLQAEFFEPDKTKVVDTSCGNLTFPRMSLANLQQLYIDKIDDVTIDQCRDIEVATRNQSNSIRWHQERKHRLTASTFGTILKRKKNSETFVLSLIHPKQFTSAPTSYGLSNEKRAIEKYVQLSGNHVHDCGFIVNSSFPSLGASPDGKVCSKGVTGLIEVKCPYSARDMTLDEAVMNRDFCLEISNNEKHLRENHHYYFQVQGQLMVSGAEFCDFVVFTRKDFNIHRILPNLQCMQNMLDRLSEFYFTSVKPVLDIEKNSVNALK